MADATPRKKPVKRARSAAQIDKDVQALKSDVEELGNTVQQGFAQLADLLSNKRAEALNAEVQSRVVYDEPQQPQQPRVKAAVGERPGDKLIRNLRPQTLHLRLGNPRDPFRVNLEGRGRPGDTDQIPASLVGDIFYKRNLNNSFEEISSDEYNALQAQYAGYGGDGYGGGYDDVELSHDEDRTIATMRDMQDPRRKGVGPRYVDVPGSDQGATRAAQSATGQVTQAEIDEYNTYQRRQRGLIPPDPSDPSGREAAARMQRAQDPRPGRYAGNDAESQAMARKIAELEGRGVIPQGELNKPVVFERGGTQEFNV